MRRLKVNSPKPEVIILSESSSEEAPGKKRVNIAPVFLHGRKKRRCDPETLRGETLQGETLHRSPAGGLRLRAPPAGPDCAEVPPLPSAALLSCLDGIQTSNPAFPVRAAFSSLQRRSRIHDVSEQHVTEDGPKAEISPRVSKSLGPGPSAPGVDGHCRPSVQEVPPSPRPPVPRSSKLSRSRRLKVRNQISTGTNPTGSAEPTPKTSDSLQQVPYVEDRLWTEKYSPQHSSDIIGNPEPLNKLHSWLKRWKSRADRDAGRRTEEQNAESSNGPKSSFSFQVSAGSQAGLCSRADCWDCGTFQGEAGSDHESEERLSTAMLITGPPGVGKTASVYACAQEFGFKVFEVNCSSQRSGRLLLSHLKEATQSHLVDPPGTGPLRPAYINHFNTSSAPKSESFPAGKAAMLSLSRRGAMRSSRSSARRVKTKPATISLAHFFKTKAKADRCHFGGSPPPERTDANGPEDSSLRSDQTPPRRRKTATSLVLFEEVHVVFDDDVGFLAAVKTFMATTKRPVVLTTNDPSFRRRFGCSLEEIVYKPPSAASACSFLQLVCLAEGVRVEAEDVDLLFTLSGGDVRRCLLQLQLWVQSRGGAARTDVDDSGGSDLQLLPGCSAFMLGLQPATLEFLLHRLKCPSWPQTELNELLSLLAESWRRRQPLLYANLELLLDSARRCQLPAETFLLQDDVRIRGNPTVQPGGNLSTLRQRKDSSSVSSLPTLTHKPGTSPSSSGTCSSVGAERKAARVVTDCLDSLAEFFHLMSSLDAAGELTTQPEALVWTGAELKDGLLDEEAEEEEGTRIQEGLLLDVRAAAEGLGGRRCFGRVCEAWTEARSCRRWLDEPSWKSLTESLAANGSSRRTRLRLNAPPLCAPSVRHRRLELSRAVLSGEYFSLQGNRAAVGLDYLPLLRFVCRSHKAQQRKQPSTRCRNYLSRKRLGLSKPTLRLLAEDF